MKWVEQNKNKHFFFGTQKKKQKKKKMEEQLGSIKCKLVSKCGFKKEKTSIIVKLWVTVVKRATKQTNKGPK